MIRLKKHPTHPRGFRIPPKPQEKSKTNDIDRQIDISYPLRDLTEQIDMELIELMLSADEIRIEKKLNECANEFFRRITVQLERTEGTDETGGKIPNGRQRPLFFRCR